MGLYDAASENQKSLQITEEQHSQRWKVRDVSSTKKIIPYLDGLIRDISVNIAEEGYKNCALLL